MTYSVEDDEGELLEHEVGDAFDVSVPVSRRLRRARASPHQRRSVRNALRSMRAERGLEDAEPDWQQRGLRMPRPVHERPQRRLNEMPKRPEEQSWIAAQRSRVE